MKTINVHWFVGYFIIVVSSLALGTFYLDVPSMALFMFVGVATSFLCWMCLSFVSVLLLGVSIYYATVSFPGKSIPDLTQNRIPWNTPEAMLISLAVAVVALFVGNLASVFGANITLAVANEFSFDLMLSRFWKPYLAAYGASIILWALVILENKYHEPFTQDENVSKSNESDEEFLEEK